MYKALLVIDYTVDFVAEDGALTCGQPAREIDEAIASLAREFIENDEYVVFAVDKHGENDVNHPETKLFPPHNVTGSKGRELYGDAGGVFEAYKDRENVIYMDKTRYSCFAGTDLFLRLAERKITEIHVAGVCTDICVLHTLVDGYNMGFSLVVHENCVASFNAAGHEWALGHFKGCLGARLV